MPCDDRTITIPRGDTWPFQVQVPGIDLTGYTVLFTVKETLDDDPTDAAAVIRASGAVDGQTANFSLSSTDTDLPGARYWWDVTFISSDGSVSHFVPPSPLIVVDTVTNRSA